jgi:hypothetical protein
LDNYEPITFTSGVSYMSEEASSRGAQVIEVGGGFSDLLVYSGVFLELR